MKNKIKSQLVKSKDSLQRAVSYMGYLDGNSGYAILIREAERVGLRGFNHKGNPEGTAKSIRRWDNGGFQVAIKKIASRLVASGIARKPFAYVEDMHLAMCHNARL